MDTVLGLVELTLYVAFILALSAGVTLAVIKLFPVGGRHKPAPDEST
jgi:hypothetical protein